MGSCSQGSHTSVNLCAPRGPLAIDGCDGGRKSQRLQTGPGEGPQPTPCKGSAHTVLLIYSLPAPPLLQVTSHLAGSSLSSDCTGELGGELDSGEGMWKPLKVHILFCEWEMSS